MPAGKSIIGQLWDEMDACYERLMADGEPAPFGPGYAEEDRQDSVRYGEQRGRCQSLAYALAIMTNPYAPSMDAVKAEARRRWQGRALASEGAAVVNSGEGE